MEMLTVDEVLLIYDVLVRDFVEAADPIAPAGVRDRALLDSAVSRQYTAIGVTLKYPTVPLNAATLTYGICCDHPFFNGNKRAALVAMLVHLDKNGYCLPSTTQGDLYTMITAIADHRFGAFADRRGHFPRLAADEQVALLSQWLKKRVARVTKGERPITYRQLRRILSAFNIALENTGQNSAELVRYVEARRGILGRRTLVRQRIATIGYRDDGTALTKAQLKDIRRLCRLREEDGVDSSMFYTTGEVIDAFVNRYRTVLRRLART
jgi:death-on-curing protein